MACLANTNAVMVIAALKTTKRLRQKSCCFSSSLAGPEMTAVNRNGFVQLFKRIIIQYYPVLCSF